MLTLIAERRRKSAKLIDDLGQPLGARIQIRGAPVAAQSREVLDSLPPKNVGGFRRPWNAKPEARRLAKGIPRAPLWAYSPGGENQVGCIYTAQGFEFDYVGVIFGTDLVYRPGEGWKGDKRNSQDSIVKRAGERFVELVKNTYRVLLTREMKGCYVCFLDKANALTWKWGDTPKIQGVLPWKWKTK